MNVGAARKPDRDAMKAVMAEMPSAVTIVTTWTATGDPIGATLSAVSPLSLAPPLMLACFDQGSNTGRALMPGGGHFLIHILGAGQQHLAARFAGKSPDKFASANWHRGLLDLPQLAECVGVVACSVENVIPGGDHVIIVGGIRALVHDGRAQALLYHRRHIYPIPAGSEDTRSAQRT
ncbi:MAG: reductase [Gammaproteobacteria bacterium]|nr:reductase [Gammaproteobacteria bacterium]